MNRTLTVAALALCATAAWADPPALKDAATPATAASVPATATVVRPHEAILGPTDPIAGYNGSFFIRDPNNWFVLMPKGRMQVDYYSFPGRGDPPMGVDYNTAKDPRPRDTLFVRRMRPELMGVIGRHFEFQLGGEFGTTPSTGQYGTLTDAFVNVNYTPYAQLQLGQFDAPFTLENRTSDKYFDFMERSLAVRAFGVPLNKEAGAMLWGYFPNKVLYYSFGVFNGDGQSFKNQDNKPAVIGRAFVAPLAPMAHGRRWLEDMWVGGSIWWQVNQNLGANSGVAPSVSGATLNDIPGMSTQGAFGFFSSNYNNGTDANNNNIRSHLAPNGQTLKWALEANVPITNRFGARFEFVHQTVELSQYNDSTNLMTASVARAPVTGTPGLGKLDGYGYYVEAWGWIIGDMTMIETPGVQTFPKLKPACGVLDAKCNPRWGLMAAARYEHVGFNVSGLTPAGAKLDPAEGDYAIDAVELGLNAWFTKHVRLSANYVLNYIGGFDAKDAMDTANTASANLKKNNYYNRAEHELLFRIGIAL